MTFNMEPIRVGGATFTHPVYLSAEINIRDGKILSLSCPSGAHEAYFASGGTKGRKPQMLLAPMGQSGSISSKVSIGGVNYNGNAAALYLYESSTSWNRLALTRDEKGRAVLTATRMQGTHELIPIVSPQEGSDWLRLSLSPEQVTYSCSLDGQNWEILATCEHSYTAPLWAGVSCECSGSTCGHVEFSYLELRTPL